MEATIFARSELGSATRSLSGLRIAVTRPVRQAGELAEALRALGADTIVCPTIRLEFGKDAEALARAAAGAHAYRWIVFTSANGVEAFFEELERSGSDADRLRPVRIAAIGPATARALAGRGIEPELVPERYVAEAVADAILAEDDLRGARVLLPRAAGARAVLPRRLREAGAEVDVVEAYAARPDEEGIARLREAVEKGGVDVVTFTAASTVRSFVEAAGPDLGRARVAAIGPITAAAARDLGLEVHVVASEYTIAGLVEAIREWAADTGRA